MTRRWCAAAFGWCWRRARTWRWSARPRTAPARWNSLRAAVPTSSSWMFGCRSWTVWRQRAGSQTGTSARIVMLTTFDSDEYVYEALRAGASGFLLKDVQPGQLVDAIRVVARGEALLAPTVTRRLLDRFAHTLPDRNWTAPPALAELTERELEVLTLLASGLSNAELAERMFVSETTVKTHVSSILRKLDLRDRVQAVVLAYQAGLVRPRPS